MSSECSTCSQPDAPYQHPHGEMDLLLYEIPELRMVTINADAIMNTTKHAFYTNIHEYEQSNNVI